MSRSVLSNEEHYDTNYGVPYEQQKDAANKIKKLGHKVRELDVKVWLVNGQYISPATMLRRIEEGYYVEKETDAGRDAEVEVPTHTRRSSRPVGKGLDSGDTDKRVSKRKGTRSNGTRTSKAVRGSHKESVEQESTRKTRKKTSTLRKRGTSLSRSWRDYDTRETQVGRKRRSQSDRSESRGVKRGTRSRQATSRRRN
jgi:hypothetical protein